MPSPPTRPAPGAALSLWARSSHDLRQPLHGLKLLTGLVAGEADAARRDTICANMTAGLQALQTMIDTLSELAALEASAAPPAVAPCALDAMLADIAGELQPAAAHRSGSISAAANGLTISSNPRWLRELVRSLAILALWLDPAARVALSARLDGCHTVIEIASSTAPQPAALPSKSARLFTELPALANATPTLTVGLGMDLMQHAAGLLGATIETTGPVAGGTVYVVRPR